MTSMAHWSNDTLKDLARYRQIKFSVIGRKSGNTISIPVWFVPEGGAGLLGVVYHSDHSPEDVQCT
jgi:hypothetical protein